MKVLLHICCGPCAIGPVHSLRTEGFGVTGFFYNPNICPRQEYERRRTALECVSRKLDLDVIYPVYDPADFPHQVCDSMDINTRHAFCWDLRLSLTADKALELGIAHVTTTLLGSPYQDVEKINFLGDQRARERGLNFLSRNFRRGFAESRKLSKEWKIYHQHYCGCSYSQRSQKVRQTEAGRVQ